MRKNIFLFILLSICYTPVAKSNHSKTNVCMKSIEQSSQVHNMQMLSLYKSFLSEHPVKHAFFTTPNRLEVTLKEPAHNTTFNIILRTYDYEQYNQEFNKFEEKEAFVPQYFIEDDKLIIEHNAFDLKQNYTIEINGSTSNVYLSPEIGGILDNYFDATSVKDLGLSYFGSNATIKVWSPPAARIELLLFDKKQNPIPLEKPLQFTYTENGVWKIHVHPRDIKASSLDGLYYQFAVYAYGQKRIALDPYAKSMAAFDTTMTDKIGKAAIVNMNSFYAKPTSSPDSKYMNSQFMANDMDMIAYEIHVRDFTIQPGVVEDEIAGTFKGFNKKINYLKQLGITHVQFLPVNNFYTVDENDIAYKPGNSPLSNYNWGYDPHNYFSLEGWFSTNAKNPYARIKEYRELVQNLHKNGIGVIMDVVYNHSYTVETFENVAPGCYFRYDNALNISGTTGAGPSLESRRKMVRKLIIESLVHFVKEYDIDGFRFDLMGFHDHETMLAIREIVGAAYNLDNPNELILQGEAWVFSDLDTDINAEGIHAATTKLNYPKENFKIAFFNDSSRDSYTGREQNKGFAQGIAKEFDRVASGIIGGLKNYTLESSILNTPAFNDPYNRFAYEPHHCLNYLTIHDGFTLWDKINLSWKDATKYERARIMRLANAMLFTSQGKLIMHGGDEILRTKPLAAIDKESNRAHTSEWVDEEEGTVYFHENSYCSNDYTNMIRWDRLENEYYDIANGMLSYYKGLIKMRRHLPCLRYQKSESIQKGLVFLMPPQEHVTNSLYSSFYDEKLDKLSIEFVNGPPHERLYLAGEIYPKGMSDNSDKQDMYFIDFDADGKGQIVFSKEQIRQFDLNKWSDINALNIKLVKTPGSWEFPEKAYTTMGHNVIHLEGINAYKKTTIDLGIADYSASEKANEPPLYVAYWLDNTLETDIPKGFKPAPFTELIVVHNTSDDILNLSLDIIGNPTDWVVILDSYNAGITPLQYSSETTSEKGKTNVLIGVKNIEVPYKSTAVIAKIKK